MVAQALTFEPFEALYTSPLRRALETAQVIGAAVGLHATVEEDLAEFDRGAQYLHFEDVGATADVYQRLLLDDLTPWGTTAPDFRARVTGAFDRIIAAHPVQSVLVVSHGGVANAYLGGLLGMQRIYFHAPEYGSISRVQASGSGIRSLVSVNETAHLRRPLCPDRDAHEPALQRAP